AAAASRANYRVTAPGPDGRFGTRDDRVIRLRTATYNPANRSVTLRPMLRLPFRKIYRLTAAGTRATGVADRAGNPLDGHGGGRPGGAFVTVIRARNLAGPASAWTRGVTASHWLRKIVAGVRRESRKLMPGGVPTLRRQ